MSAPANLDRAEAISARVSSDACKGKTAVLPCGATLHIGCFFDGFARNLEQDLQDDRASNVGRLFMAHPDDDLAPSANSFERHKRFYISGLGAPFDSTLGGGAALAGTGMAGAASKAKDNLSKLPAGTATDMGVEAGQDILTGKNWWERMLNNLSPEKLRVRGLAGAATGVVTAGVEGVPIMRDNEQMAELFKTGVETRLEAAAQALNDTLNKVRAQSDVPLKRIAVSVYGFDFGATLARAFSHKLFAECEPGTTRYQGIALDIVFAGLFDAVDRSMASSIVLDYWLPLVSQVDDGECLPGPTKAALHLVAAHECRGTRRARLIGTGVSTPRWEERLVPGISEDVGGGLRKEDAPSSRELHLACLHEMYRAAYRAGVPFPQMEQLQREDKYVASFFVLNDHINGISALDASTRYQDKVGARQPSADAFLQHRRWYIRRLRGLWQMYREQYRAFEEEEARLERPLMGSGGVFARHLGLGNESPAQAATRDRVLAQVRARKAALRNSLGWLEQVQMEADMLGRHSYSAPTQALLDEWYAPVAVTVSFDIEDVLELFLNDRYMISQLSPTITTLKYFVVRDFDSPDWRKTAGTLPSPLEQVAR
ncbi:hypothetical protein [Pseudomonas sp.]|uniref:hypothetical protein n=1 Tax=Pseudomonas sp. TaxID=306 RepID=UPI003C74158B